MADLSYWKVLTRRKTLTIGSDSDSKLNRVLGTFDLTALGVGATLGVGVYVLPGHVARDQAGPSVILSFAIAAFASLLAGLCYAEFGSRVPKAGSAYIYSYVCIGELAAFIIGWNLILEYIIGSASVSKGLSLYLDTLVNDTLKTTFREIAPINSSFLGEYFDFFAFGAAFILGMVLAFGLKQSTIISNCLTVLNVAIVIYVVIAGSLNADLSMWSIDPTTVVDTGQNVGNGGFFPFGFEGTLKGAATCFFGFVGFDCIATTGEEVKNPRRAIPKAILFSLLIIFLSYFCVSTVLTLMLPYYDQNVNAPLPYVFQKLGWNVARWIVTIGGMIGLIASLFGAMFPLPRIIYAMSEDGLVFKFLGHISPRFKTPTAGTICAGTMTGLFGAIFNLEQLVNMLSIGTLLAYTVIAISITLLRFMDNNQNANSIYPSEMTESTNLVGNKKSVRPSLVLKQIFNLKCMKTPNPFSTKTVGGLLIFYCLLCLGLSVTLMFVPREIPTWGLALLISLGIILLTTILAISVQPRENPESNFYVPFVPLTPGISIFMNIYLMLQLDYLTWIRFGIWMAIGLPVYIACSCMYNRTGVRNDSILFRKPHLLQNGKKPHSDGSISMSSTSRPIPPIVVDHASDGDISGEMTKIDEISVIPHAEMSHNSANGKAIMVGKEEDRIIVASEIEKVVEKNEDPKTVIAMLDNVLQFEESSIAAETKILQSPEPQFSTQISTVAMVHVCDETKDKFDTRKRKTEEEIQAALAEKEENEEKALASVAELFTIENESLSSSKTPENVIVPLETKSETDEETEDSSKDNTLVNASKSKKFLEKLSFLLARSPPVTEKSSVQTPAPPLNEDENNNEQPKIERFEIPKAKSISGIPKPPKFDPVLYKTVSARAAKASHNRPKLDMEAVSVHRSKSSENISTAKESPTQESPTSFRSKLESLLKRGLSMRQTKPPPFSQTPINLEQSEIVPEVKENGSIPRYHVPPPPTATNVPPPPPPPFRPKRITFGAGTSIEDIRKGLRHVHTATPLY